MIDDGEEDVDTVIQANQSEGISPELEEKIHEMQVNVENLSIDNSQCNLTCCRFWKSSCQLCLRTQTISSRYFQPTSVKNWADVVTQVLSMYLSCSGYEEITNACLDRVVCEYANEESDVEQEERDVISMWVLIISVIQLLCKSTGWAMARDEFDVGLSSTETMLWA